ncbi:MAG: SDR family NAD(P)-dependent oxidoreductase [Clostridiales bacterium]|nr:SDR family NAD(P)-dependent oxidoreductase [Clostridiales bacterium]
MKIAVITGASSGMGREFVLQLEKKEKFDEIWVIARRKERLEELISLVKTPLRVMPLDLSSREGWDAYASALAEATPDVRVLVNASGFGRFGNYEEVALQDSLGMIDLNCKALVAMTELTLPYMQRGAKILELDSLSSFQPVPYINVYGATKAFVLSYSRALNVELSPRGIRVMAMCPGWVKTEFFDHAMKEGSSAVTYFNIMFTAAEVVKTGIRDLYHSKKDVSIHDFRVKAQVFGTKLLPHRLVMRIWMKQQKHSYQ